MSYTTQVTCITKAVDVMGRTYLGYLPVYVDCGSGHGLLLCRGM